MRITFEDTQRWLQSLSQVKLRLSNIALSKLSTSLYSISLCALMVKSSWGNCERFFIVPCLKNVTLRAPHKQVNITEEFFFLLFSFVFVNKVADAALRQSGRTPLLCLGGGKNVQKGVE